MLHGFPLSIATKESFPHHSFISSYYIFMNLVKAMNQSVKVKRKVDEKTNATNADESTNREDQQKEIRKPTSEQSNYDPQGEHSKEA